MIRWSTVDDNTKSFQELVKHLEPVKGRPICSDSASLDLWHKKESELKKCLGDACRFASLQMVKLVFDATESMDMNRDRIQGPRGDPIAPLIWAAEHSKYELAEFCIRVGADPFVHEGGKTALDVAKHKGDTKLVVLLQQAMKGNYMGQVKWLFRKFSG